MSRKEEIEARKLEIREEVEAAEDKETIDTLNEEVEALNAEVKEIEEHQEEEEVAETLEQPEVKAMVKEVSIEEKKEDFNMETRNTKEYINAYAEYIKTGKEEELRALLTENVSGGVAVPDMVYDIVKTAWEKDDIMSLVKRVEVRGNLKVNFELTAGEATVHTEGGNAVSEEELTLGIVTLTPVSIKKWISISDEVYDMRGEEFLRYIYDELTQKIVKKTADTLVGLIAALPATATATSVSANVVTAAPGVGVIANALGQLSDEATKPVIIMNKGTWSAFKAAQYAGNFNVDPFEGLEVRFNNTLPAYGDADAADVYAIVGDLENGTLANYPNGEGVDIKFDDKTLMTSDLIRILGRQYVGLGVVADKAFALIAKPTE